MNKVYIIGVGPGNTEYILPIAQKYASKCDILIGAKRNLEAFDCTNKKTIELCKNLNEIIDYIKQNKENEQIGVVVSGDTGFYSLLSFIKKHFNADELEVIPGISSVSYLFSKLSKTYDDYLLISLHGKPIETLTYAIKLKQKIVMLTDNINNPKKIADFLIDNGYSNAKMIIGCNLSYDDEFIIYTDAMKIENWSSENLCVVVIEIV